MSWSTASLVLIILTLARIVFLIRMPASSGQYNWNTLYGKSYLLFSSEMWSGGFVILNMYFYVTSILEISFFWAFCNHIDQKLLQLEKFKKKSIVIYRNWDMNKYEPHAPWLMYFLYPIQALKNYPWQLFNEYSTQEVWHWKIEKTRPTVLHCQAPYTRL